jgi:tRNA-splicing ligase RtcB (3'-phosphate/5'-hydroxy nucleic acid ligase)
LWNGLGHLIGAEFMRPIQDNLAAQGILVRSPSTRGIAEKTPGAHEDVGAVLVVAEQAG